MPYEVFLHIGGIPYSYAENISGQISWQAFNNSPCKAQGVAPLLANRDKAKSDSLTEYLPNHIIIQKNLTKQVGMDKKQKGDELVLLADPLWH